MNQVNKSSGGQGMRAYQRYVSALLIMGCVLSEAGLMTGHRPTGRRVVKVAVAAYEPILETTNGAPCNAPYWQVCKWYAPSDVVEYAIAACAAAWDGAVEFKIVHWTNVNMFPHFMNTDSPPYYYSTNRWGEKRYRTDNEHYWMEYTSGWKWGGTPTPDAKMGQYGYWIMLTNDFPHLLAMVDRGEVDTIFTPGGPYFGMWETQMAGKGAYYCNSPPVGTTNERLVVIGGIGYTERKGSGLHNYGHGLGETGLGSWFFNNVLGYDNNKSGYTNVNDFVLFTRCAKFTGASGQPIHCGNTHFAPNSVADYEYNSSSSVWCSADQWYSYPLMTNAARWMNNADWSTYASPFTYEDDRFQMWWWNHLPRYMGSQFANPVDRFRKGHMNNWLSYIWNHNAVGFPIGSHQLITHTNTDLRGWFSYRIYAPPGTTQIYIHATAGRNVRFMLRKNYVPVYRGGSISEAADNRQDGAGEYIRTIHAGNNYGRGVTGVWYLSFGGSGEAWNHNTYTQTVYVTILPKPTNTVAPIITITRPTAISVFDKAKAAREWIRWHIEAPSLPQGVRATYIAYQLTNGVSPWVPLCEDYIFNLQDEYEWTLPEGASTNAHHDHHGRRVWHHVHELLRAVQAEHRGHLRDQPGMV